MTSIPLMSLWSNRSLVLQMALMNIKIRYKGTRIGLLWTALEPTLTFVILYIVFTSIRIREQENFGIYLLAGIFIYHIFSRGTLGGLTSLQANKNILQSLFLDKEFFVSASTLTTTLLTIVEVAVLFALFPFFQYTPPWTIVFLPLVILMLLALIQGFAYFLSVVYVFYKDIQLLWGVVLHAAFFVTPIIWYVDDVSGILLDIHRFNPIGQLVELGHKLIIFGEIPSIYEWVYAASFVVSIFLVGYFVFRKYQDRVVEEL